MSGRKYNRLRTAISAFRIPVLFIILLVCDLRTAYAQPANDNCANATVINIPGGGFGLGTFTSSKDNMGAATIQPGETFAPAIFAAGLDRKSLWYKFTLPTKRLVSV